MTTPETLAALPIDPVLPELCAALRRAGAVVLHAPTGAGKTTRVPRALLGELEGRIVVLEPRRVAARAAARRVAEELGEGRPGRTVGYQVRFERCASAATRILFVTPGILVRMLQADPALEEVGAIVFDEFHERSLEADLALALVRSVREALRPELRLVVMSATLAAEPIAAWLGEVPVVSSPGRLHPIDLEHTRSSGAPDHHDLADRTAAAIRDALERQERGALPGGDVLVFLPGMREIRATEAALGGLGRALVLPLHGRLPSEQQDAVFEPAPPGVRKVVLATNVAETSLTLPGVSIVIDSGLARVLRYDPTIGLDRLGIERISRESATQRAGRAGRERPGYCLRLWSEIDQARLAESTPPEIRRVELMPVALQLLCWGERELESFGWFEAPEVEALEAALRGLRRLGALTVERQPTALGRAMAAFPAHPRIARLVLEGRARGVAKGAALLAAVISEPEAPGAVGTAVPGPARSDVLEAAHRASRDPWLSRVRDQLLRAAEEAPASALPAAAGDSGGGAAEEALLRCVLAGFPDRVCLRRGAGDERAVMVGGRGVRIARESRLEREATLFVAVDVEGGRRGERSEGLVRRASAIEERWLATERRTVLRYDEANDRIVAVAQRVYPLDPDAPGDEQALVLDERPAPLPSDGSVAAFLASLAVPRAATVLGLDEPGSAASQLLARLACLRAACPELAVPALDERAIGEVVAAHCEGLRSLRELETRVDWGAALRGHLGYALARQLDELCPTRVALFPGEPERPLSYPSDGRAPVLAVRIQEMFGVADTPRIAGGRIAVLLHLLAPNMRPQQVTSDLASFWRTGYPEVRKELRARYPKHAWPEDPLVRPPPRRRQS